VSFLLAGISAYRWWRGDRAPSVLAALRTGVMMAAVLVPAQIFLGDLHGLNTLEHQPAKVAAMEGIWETQRGAPAVLLAWPDETTRSNLYEIAIPKLASLYLRHHLDGEVQGMLAVSWLAAWQFKRLGTLQPLVVRVLIAMTFSGWIATLAGWYVTEVGRQPYLVYGLLTTAQAAAQIPVPMVATTLAMYLSVYVVLLVAYVLALFHMARKVGQEAT